MDNCNLFAELINKVNSLEERLIKAESNNSSRVIDLGSPETSGIIRRIKDEVAQMSVDSFLKKLREEKGIETEVITKATIKQIVIDTVNDMALIPDDLEEKIERVIDNYDFDSHLENAIDEYDFDSKFESYIEDNDVVDVDQITSDVVGKLVSKLQEV